MKFLNFNGQLFNNLSAKYQRLAQGEPASQSYDGSREMGAVEKVRNVVVHGSSRMKAFLAGGVFVMLLIMSWGWRGDSVVGIDVCVRGQH